MLALSDAEKYGCVPLSSLLPPAGALAAAPSPLALAPPHATAGTAAEGPLRPTTETARRILATLEALDAAVAPKAKAARASTTQVQQQGEAEGPAASPPPRESIAFAGGLGWPWAACHTTYQWCTHTHEGMR